MLSQAAAVLPCFLYSFLHDSSEEWCAFALSATLQAAARETEMACVVAASWRRAKAQPGSLVFDADSSAFASFHVILTGWTCAVAAASQQAARETELARAAEEGRRRGKAKPGSLVINPDGYTYSYAVKIEALSEGSTGRHSRTGSQTLEGVGAEGSTSRHMENGSQSQENSISEGSAGGHLRGSSQILEEAEMGQPSAGNSNSGGACDSRAGDAQSAFAHYSTAAGQGGETRESSVGSSGPSEGAFAEAQPSASSLPKPRVCSRSSRSRTDVKSEVALASRLQYDSHAEVSGSQESISSIAQQQPPQRHM